MEVLKLQLALKVAVGVEVGIEPAKATLIYSKMSVIPFDSNVVLKTVKRISVKDL